MTINNKTIKLSAGDKIWYVIELASPMYGRYVKFGGTNTDLEVPDRSTYVTGIYKNTHNDDEREKDLRLDGPKYDSPDGTIMTNYQSHTFNNIDYLVFYMYYNSYNITVNSIPP